ncbi:hypothetical protein I6E29_03970 [Arcanobacterium haemolyticum]|nr:hypothetical protein [Arcanobacterium haemolyticum]
MKVLIVVALVVAIALYAGLSLRALWRSGKKFVGTGMSFADGASAALDAYPPKEADGPIEVPWDAERRASAVRSRGEIRAVRRVKRAGRRDRAIARWGHMPSFPRMNRRRARRVWEERKWARSAAGEVES